MKPERIQEPIAPDLPEQEPSPIAGWQVDPQPNAIIRRFEHKSFADSVKFLTEIAPLVEQHHRPPFFVLDGAGVTARLGNPPESGVGTCELELAEALMKAAA